MRSESTRTRWAFLLVISLGLFIVAADNSILYVALPTLRSELHTTHQQGLWIINAYPLVLAGLLLGTGTLGDKIGHRRMFEVGLVIFGLASTAAAFAPNVAILIAARGFLGAGAAVLMPSTLALIRQTFLEHRHWYLGIRSHRRFSRRPTLGRLPSHSHVVGSGVPDQHSHRHHRLGQHLPSCT